MNVCLFGQLSEGRRLQGGMQKEGSGGGSNGHKKDLELVLVPHSGEGKKPGRRGTNGGGLKAFNLQD